MQKLVLLIFLAYGLVITSCTEDNFSQVVDISIPDHVSLPTMAMEVSSGDSVLYPILSRSFGITEDQPEGTERNNLRLLRDGELIGELNVSINEYRFGLPYMELTEPINDQESTYEVIGEVNGYGTATATQVMPAVPAFTVVSYEREGAIDQEGVRVDVAIIDIQDPAGVANYYGFNINTKYVEQISCDTQTPPNCDTIFGTDFTYVSSTDPLLVEGGKYGLVLSDQSFQGNTYRVRLQFDNFQSFPPLLEVFSLTEDTYRYSVSFEAYQNARDNPFSEPVTVHDNINDGYGFFLISNRKVEELRE